MYTTGRSVIKEGHGGGSAAVVAKHVELGKKVCAAGVVPIIEPEVNIHSDSKAEAEDILVAEIEKQLNGLPEGEMVMLKLTIPEKDGLYDGLADHDNVLRVVALSGGYSTDGARERLGRTGQVSARPSRARRAGARLGGGGGGEQRRRGAGRGWAAACGTGPGAANR